MTRTFQLHRDHDVSGLSGTGVVADGVTFPDGVTVIRWRGERQSTVVWPSVDDVVAIHGHGGATRLVWDDPAPAPSVVPEAAVEAAASAVRKERAFSAAAAFGVPIDDVPHCAEMIARAALTAALPLLTAAPSATREEVARALEGEFGCFLARDPHRPDAFWGGAADTLLARFTITPKEDR